MVWKARELRNTTRFISAFPQRQLTFHITYDEDSLEIAVQLDAPEGFSGLAAWLWDKKDPDLSDQGQFLSS
jgi:hypothetical protein